MRGLQISSTGTKAYSLSETGDRQGSIWQPVHWASRVDDLEMKNANNASLLQVSWQERVNLIHSFLNVSLSLPLWLCHSPSPCYSVFPALSFVRHPHRWLGEPEVGRQRQDTLFVSQQRTCLARLRFQPRCQTKSHLVQELQDKL